MKRLIGLAVFGFVCITFAGVRDSVDHKAGPGTFHAAVNDGLTGAKETYSEAAQVPAIMIEAVKPGAVRLGAQFNGVLGGVVGPTTSTTAPQQWDNRVTPSEQAPGQ